MGKLVLYPIKLKLWNAKFVEGRSDGMGKRTTEWIKSRRKEKKLIQSENCGHLVCDLEKLLIDYSKEKANSQITDNLQQPATVLVELHELPGHVSNGLLDWVCLWESPCS